MNGVENSIGMEFYDMGMEHLHMNGIEGVNEWEGDGSIKKLV